MSRAWRIGYMAGRIIVIPLMILVALGVAWAVGAVVRGITDNDESSKSATTAAPATAAPDTSLYSLPTVATTAPTTTIPKVAVPNLVGKKLARAKTILIDRRLHWSTRYKTTARYSSRTVISQSPKAGASLRPGSNVTLVIAKAPPPTTAPPPPPTTAPRNCDPSYPDVCLHQGIGDYDCASGKGNGPNYVDGPITVLPPDPFDLDGNGDGIGCEQG
jgi:cytoskeletal protein RodZ